MSLCVDKPRITLEPSPLNILLGASKQLRCLVSANPPVTRVSWRKDTQTLSSKTKIFLKNNSPFERYHKLCLML